MAKKILISSDRVPARPMIRQATGNASLERSLARETLRSSGTADFDSLIVGIYQYSRSAEPMVRSSQTGKPRRRIITISHFEEARFELEITTTRPSTGADTKNATGRRAEVARAPRVSKHVRKLKAHQAKS